MTDLNRPLRSASASCRSGGHLCPNVSTYVSGDGGNRIRDPLPARQTLYRSELRPLEQDQAHEFPRGPDPVSPLMVKW